MANQGGRLDYSKWDHIRTDDEEKKARDEQKVRAVPEDSSRRKRDTVGRPEPQRFVNHGLRVAPRPAEGRFVTARAARRSASSRARASPPSRSATRWRRWEEGRAKWLEVSPNRQPARRHPPVDDDLIYDTIFSKPMGWLLPHPVPLAHMVELLEDEWSD
jgi:hypothetical protein